MSHLPERTEKTCLNCNTALDGRFCHACGQENIEPRETFWGMLTHFVFDLFHFDGKFFSTLNFLLFKPGYLSLEHLKGRRAAYLHPIRMYVFISAFFFILFFLYTDDGIKAISINTTSSSSVDSLAAFKKLEKEYQLKIDSATTSKAKDSLQKVLKKAKAEYLLVANDSNDIKGIDSETDTIKVSNALKISPRKTIFKTKAAYDSSQNSLPLYERDGFVRRKIEYQQIHLNNDFTTVQEGIQAMFVKFFHSLPKMLFISLPLFAFMLHLLYIRNKKYYFSDHLVYSIHLYCAFFIIILIAMTIKFSAESLGLININVNDKKSVFGNALNGISSVLILVYWYKSIRKFYGQSRLRSVLKFILLLFIDFFIFIFLFLSFIAFSAMTI